MPVMQEKTQRNWKTNSVEGFTQKFFFVLLIYTVTKYSRHAWSLLGAYTG